MLKEKRSRRSRRGNILILVTLMVPLLVGLVGLAIDGTMCYIVQGQLSAAVDGAALGTGRMLNVITTDVQAQDVAMAFLNANFRTGQGGFWGARFNGTPTVVASAASSDITKSVKVTAMVNVPLLFMRIFGQSTAQVAATGTATRRDARIEFVIDRSGSMNQSYGSNPAVLPTLKTYAATFTQGFTEGADEMGLVVYSNSGVVAYPRTATAPYRMNLTGGSCPTAPCGPDGNFQDGTSNDMVHQINNIAGQNDTNMGDALALAYVEIQKAHLRDMAQNNGVDSRQNYVVLFTDGVPNTYSTYINNPHDPRNVTNPTNLLLKSAGTGCSAASLDDSNGPPVGGAVGKNPVYGANPIIGAIESTQQTSFFQLGSLDGAHTSNAYVSASSGTAYDNIASNLAYPNPSSYGCSESNIENLSSLNNIPSLDAYGYNAGPNNETGTAGYKYSSFLNRVAANTPLIWDGTHNWGAALALPITVTYNLPTQPAGASYQIGMAAWNVVDNIASAIRSDSNYLARGDTDPMVITIMTIGYTGDGGTDAGLLSKVANVSGCTFNTYSCDITTGPNGVAEQNGIFIPASNTTELNNAFATLMSTILRLSQ